ncbi:AMP-binding protein [Cohnella faecalis]|uniref:AMP-dependent synthetase/ligase domain-containing protein n=1 Tax=Cohnella faecalis TaxID=2315694 RepID=A0A398CXD5_9BACL|nr:AMP-binding protein [Cohnella faecalis]RIE03881.1 hypothetical protein D3H35_07890 [Cohnella faecalis]
MKSRERVFRELLERLTKSPLYIEKLGNRNVTRLSLAQIGLLPLTRKEELRRAGSFGHLAVDMREVAQYHESFGTTGEPSASWFTSKDLKTGGKQMRECGVGLNPDDLVLIRFPYAMSLPAFLMQHAARQAGAGVVPASGRTPVTPYPRVLELMRRLGVTIVAGLPREMELLAETARLLGSDIKKDYPDLRALCVAGELTGELRRQHIERLWGVPVFNLYGSTETGNIAAMCEHGIMHIVEKDFVVETLAEDGFAPVDPGAKGFAAITTLTHEASPLLRYFNEDVVSVEACACACGRTGSKLVHYGRAKDRIRFGEIVLDGKDIQDAVYSLVPAPDAWKAVEQADGIRFLLDSHRRKEWSEEGVRARLSERLGVPVDVEFAAEGMLLDRDELVRNAPSKKPVYIQRNGDAAPDAPAANPVRDWLGRGRRKLIDGRFSEARRLFGQATAFDPSDAEAHALLAAAYGRLIEAGNMLEKIKLLPQLEKEIAAALAIDQKLPFARRMNGARLLNTPGTLGGDPSAAAEEFRYCIAHGQADADVWVSLSECYMKLGDSRQAIESLRQALDRSPKHVRANEWMRQLAGNSEASPSDGEVREDQ